MTERAAANHPSDRICQAAGDSMKDAGIARGFWSWIVQGPQSMVTLSLLPDGEFTVKKLQLRRGFSFNPMNSAYSPIIVSR